ncbi:hypothetical protein VNI00_012374 [Paramarasmius palmivorus]|uniref:F-box domain-containing protein n=1 Tax=Paramarasmius palmivorus TaxID=297713 RepID=A0AAW0C7B3_9AGAR
MYTGSLGELHRPLAFTRQLKPPAGVSTPSSLPVPHSPVNTIPVEILLEIFVLCQSNGTRDDPLLPTLHYVSTVCRHWRSVTMAAPHLWAKIALWNPQSLHESIAEEWLIRSQSCPLTVIIRHSASAPSVGWHTVAECTGRVFDLLMGHTRRWRSLTIDIAQIALPSNFAIHMEATPLLDHVDIADNDELPSSFIQLWESLLSRPSLRRLHWLNGGPGRSGYPRSIADLPWERLTHVSGSFILDDIFIDALTRCQALEVLELSSLVLPANASKSTLQCFHPHLRVLAVTCEDLSGNELANHLICPNLRRLDIRFGGLLASWTDLLSRSGCALDVLALWAYGSIAESDLLRFLSSPSLSSLTALEVAVQPLSDFVVKTLTNKPERIFFPALGRLSLILKSCPDGSLTTMVESRLASADSALKHVSIYNHVSGMKTTSSLDSQCFRHLRSIGFNINYIE